MAEEGMRLVRIVGPQTPHRYHPDSKVELDRMLDTIAERGRDPYPRKVQIHHLDPGLQPHGLGGRRRPGQHWERARLDAEIAGDSAVSVATSNVTAFTLDMGPGGCPLDPAAQARRHHRRPEVDRARARQRPLLDRRTSASPAASGALAGDGALAGLHKLHGLQGPIDDAFMDSFVFVTPTGTPLAPAVAPWVAAEQKRAIAEWRRQFRGEAQVREDKDVTDADIAASNLVLWGDPGSNIAGAHRR